MLPRPVGVDREPFLTARYEVRGLVGSGGSATVHEVFDSVRGVTLAMKRLTPEAALKQTACLLFRREYRTLRELSHPAIVRVFDYGQYEGTPFYTMEIAPGIDVRALSPLPWKEACSLLRDVVSALSLLHSRRLVHRDVSAGNVRRTPEHRGKLLDFGSLCPMGVAPEVVGTPPFVPPESLDGRPLDARSDLFSVGALAYFLLTGRHAYPATRFSELKGVWSAGVGPPSQFAPDVPEALDTLVLSLLNLNPLARPVAAPEVFDRLSTVASLPSAESGEVALGYLATPTLVGRDGVISRFRRRLLAADRGRGSTLVIEGKPGFGRSRLLGCLVTEANLANVITLCANGSDGQSRVFGVMRAFAKRLLEADPICARDSLADAAVVDTLGLSGGSDSPLSGSTLGWRTRVDSVASWFTNISARVPLVLAVDDIDDIDDASMAVIAKLSEAAPSRRLLIVATARSMRGANAARFRRLGGSHTLRPLRSYETRALVASIFDDAAGVEMVSAWIHELSEGCPRIAIELSQHLVDSGLARYESAAWVLPVSLSGLNLPEDLEQAILLRVADLGPRARTLAEGLSLCVEGEPLLLEEYSALLGVAEPEETFGALNELVAAQILVGSGSAYAFVHDAMRDAVARSIPDETRTMLHLRLADIYRRSSNRASIVASHHLMLAGDEPGAFAILARFTAERDEYVVRGYRFLRSSEGGRLHESLLDWGFASKAPMQDLLRIGMQLFGIAAVAFGDVNRHAPLVMAELERETGLVYWDEFSHIEDPAARIRACVARAAQRWSSLPDDERGLSPEEAITVFASCTTHLTGVFSRTGQVDRVAQLLPSIDRLSPVSPAVGIAADAVRFSANARRGWLAGDLRRSLLARTRTPVPGLTEPTRIGLRLLTLYYQGLEEAVLGDRLAFTRADELEVDAPYTALGWQLRTVAHLYQGQEKRAEACRRKRDVALAGQGEAERHVEAALSYESSACVVLGDLTAVKRVLPALRERASAHPGWLPHCVFVEGAHEALRGDLNKALELMLRAADMATPAEHHAWIQVEAKIAQLLIELGREREARDRALLTLETCRDVPLLPPYVDLLEASLALAEARLGDHDGAKARIAECVRRSEARGTTGILVLDLYAAQAQVALATRDAAEFASVSKRVAEMCANVDSKAFAARLSALFRMSVGAGFEPVDVTAHPFRRRMTQTLARLRTELELCAGATERATRSLGMVLQQSGAQRGYLYLHQPEGFVLAASRAVDPPPMGAEEWLLKWLRSFQSEAGETETTSEGSTFFGDRFRLVALVTDDGGAAVAPAVVVIDCDGVQPRVIPEYILRELANVLIDAGDVPRH
ncbi:MAG TPA: AAA family ATPase [Polyangiaceae bacterium]|nr:AAA family ATPase [Polyangiaceae bacterium]